MISAGSADLSLRPQPERPDAVVTEIVRWARATPSF
jgi:hypothetical protein